MTDDQALARDLVDSLRSTVTDSQLSAATERLSQLETDHAALSRRRRQLHETIDMIERSGNSNRDVAARLEKYKLNERNVSADRRIVYREIHDLQRQIARPTDGSYST